MSTDVGSFQTALLVTNTNDSGWCEQQLLHASCSVHPSIVVIIFYASETKEPQSKRTLLLNPTHLVSFIGFGYAHGDKQK